MGRRLFALFLLAAAIVLGCHQLPILGAPGAEPEDDIDAFSAETFIHEPLRGGENVHWPKDPRLKQVLDAATTLAGYNTCYSGKDHLAPVAPRIFEKIPASRKVVYLTFDDGPYTNENPEVASTEALLEAMTARGVTGTFFLQGIWSWKNRSTVQRIVHSGSNVGNHTFHHPPDGSFLSPNPSPAEKLGALTPEWQAREVLWGRAGILYAANGAKRGITNYFRAPHGSGVVNYPRHPAGQATIREIANNGHVVINGNLLLSDARSNVTSDQLIKTYREWFAGDRNGRHKGEILWLHSGIRATVKALPEIIAIVREQGYSIEALPEGLDKVSGAPSVDPLTLDGAPLLGDETPLR